MLFRSLSKENQEAGQILSGGAGRIQKSGQIASEGTDRIYGFHVEEKEQELWQLEI